MPSYTNQEFADLVIEKLQEAADAHNALVAKVEELESEVKELQSCVYTTPAGMED